MTTYRKHRKKLMAEINVVPYIDVMLVLLVIFMVTAPLLTEGVKVDLPKANARPLQTETREPFQLTVDKQGAYFVNDTPREAREVIANAAAVLRRYPETEFVVKGDRSAQYEAVVRAMVLLQQAGVERIGLITDIPDSQ